MALPSWLYGCGARAKCASGGGTSSVTTATANSPAGPGDITCGARVGLGMVVVTGWRFGIDPGGSSGGGPGGGGGGGGGGGLLEGFALHAVRKGKQPKPKGPGTKGIPRAGPIIGTPPVTARPRHLGTRGGGGRLMVAHGLRLGGFGRDGSSSRGGGGAGWSSSSFASGSGSSCSSSLGSASAGGGGGGGSSSASSFLVGDITLSDATSESWKVSREYLSVCLSLSLSAVASRVSSSSRMSYHMCYLTMV